MGRKRTDKQLIDAFNSTGEETFAAAARKLGIHESTYRETIRRRGLEKHLTRATKKYYEFKAKSVPRVPVSHTIPPKFKALIRLLQQAEGRETMGEVIEDALRVKLDSIAAIDFSKAKQLAEEATRLADNEKSNSQIVNLDF